MRNERAMNHPQAIWQNQHTERRRYFHSPRLTFAHYDFTRGSSIHEHFHPQQEVYEVIQGEIEVTSDGVTQSPKRVCLQSCLVISAIRSRPSQTPIEGYYPAEVHCAGAVIGQILQSSSKKRNEARIKPAPLISFRRSLLPSRTHHPDQVHHRDHDCCVESLTSAG